MRPVLLQIHGFASFRDQTTIDFSETDFFAFVGPTGSGKSTILDAITFALYGTAARWARANAIEWALAPTSNRCTVSLVFDIGTTRYQVAREVRRVGQSVQQKKPSLVRFHDQTATSAASDMCDSLAGEIKLVNRWIEELIGLSFEDFCQCVVLPQGAFAKFLNASSGDRQGILLKLLGADAYEGIGKRAGSRAKEAATKVTVLSEQLDGHAEVTEESERSAADRVSQLEQLTGTVVTLAEEIQSTSTTAQARNSTLATLTDKADRLDQVQFTDQMRDELTTLCASSQQAEKDLAEATGRDEAARREAKAAAAAASSGPQRATLEVAADRHAERDKLNATRADVIETAATQDQQLTDAETAHEKATQAQEAARTAHEKVLSEQRLLQQQASTLTEHLALLDTVTVPDGLEPLGAEALAVQKLWEAATTTLTAALEAQKAADEAATRAPADNLIMRAGHALTQMQECDRDIASKIATLTTTQRAHQRLAAEYEQAKKAAEQARTGLDDVRRTAEAAVLRPHLVSGEPCPVCEQAVTRLPTPVPGGVEERLKAAEMAAREADQAVERAGRIEATRASEVAAAKDAVRELKATRARNEEALADMLPDRPHGGERDLVADVAFVDELATARARLIRASRDAADAVEAARAADKAVRGDIETVMSQVSTARDALTATRARLAASFDPPEITFHANGPDQAGEVTAGWATLTAWATQSAETLQTELGATDQALTEATARVVKAAEELRKSAAATEKANAHHLDAGRRHAEAHAAKKTLLDRLTELDRLLATAPTAAELPGLLTRCDQLSKAAGDAAAAAEITDSELAAASQRTDTCRTDLRSHRQDLIEARELVANLDAPRLDDLTDLDATQGVDLVAGWERLATWAQAEANGVRDHVANIEQDTERDAAKVVSLRGELNTLLAAQNVTIQADAASAPAGIDAAFGSAVRFAHQAEREIVRQHEQAISALKTIRADLKNVAKLTKDIEEATATRQVAEALAGLMRATRFPKWLADAALDTLVAGASEALRHLSNNQYDLAHQDGDFWVIDHSDADEKRPVKTLSGGETFQASLALALALSQHLAGMGGSTKLESIFLDEGFGTLDPESLETVAETLETLADGDRMVGVVTHVPALAERIPVLFRVQHDTRTSTVTRQDAV